MSALEVFAFPTTGQEIRTVVRDDEPWFAAADVCSVLGIANPSDAVRNLDDDEYELVPAALVSSEGRPNSFLNLVTESGLYSLILRSRKPEARAFKRWITHEVLPAIRQTGRYEVARLGDDLDELDAANKRLAQAIQIARSERTARALAEAKVAELEPSAKAWDTLASADGDWSVADAAKVLSRDPAIKLGRDRLFTLLRDYGWVYRQRSDGRWRVMQTAIETGRLSELPSSHYHPRTGELVIDPPQVRVTAKGLRELHRRLGGTNPITDLTPEVNAA